MPRHPLAARVALRKLPLGLPDVALFLVTVFALYGIGHVGKDAFVAFNPPRQLPQVNLDPTYIPYYMVRSTLRMFVAMGLSLLFTFGYGYAAAHNRRAERVLIPLLDILQSVPVLGFLSITVTGFIALFKGSLLGLEAASIFAIFTSQAWNMAFSFYQSVKTVPRDLDEASRLYRLTPWQRFIKVEVPFSMVGLVWNAMMSFGGGWFFVAASEAISVMNQNYTLPGIGSYLTLAIQAHDIKGLLWAMAGMSIMVIAVNFFVWQPLVVWADRFKFEQSAAAVTAHSVVLDWCRKARFPSLCRQGLRKLAEFKPASNRRETESVNYGPKRVVVAEQDVHKDVWFNGLMVLIVVALTGSGLKFVVGSLGVPEVIKALGLGLITMARVVFLVAAATLVWVPVGVSIGFNPPVCRKLQPVVQFLAAFPANFIFPLVTIALIHFHISLNWGGILLMAMGSQWYVLFNVIAGAQSVPSELREMAANMGLKGWALWKQLILPGVFPAWVTGGITAAGGAWNASIVAEVVTWGNTTLRATGLGAYIAQATSAGDTPRIVLGVGLMSLLVVGGNRLFWRRLYHLAETKYAL